MKKKKSSTDIRELIGAEGFFRHGLKTKNGMYAYFVLSPVNISVLSANAVRQKTESLMHVLISKPDISVIALDSCENYDRNKINMERKAEKESNPKIRRLINADIMHLGRMADDLSISRQFILMIKPETDNDTQTMQTISRMEKLITDEGFTVRRADKKDVMNILSCYYSTRPDCRVPDETDGESAVKAWLEKE